MIKTRLKAAVKAFLDPAPPPAARPPATVPRPEPEPRVVLDNQLLAGKNVLVTGAGRNCGRRIALEMAKQGANIFFTDRVDQRCAELERELAAYPVTARGFVSDISSITETEALFGQLAERGIILDVLVNNVGLKSATPGLAGITADEWHNLFQTNVIGPMHLTRLAAGMMMKNGVHGSILFMTSIHQEAVSRWFSYSASKALLAALVRELAVELAPAAIRVNGIAPGWVMEDEHGRPSRHEYTPLYETSVPPRYIGRAAVFLAADYFSHATTGTILTVDGGLRLYNHRVAQEPPTVGG